jgi:hypothetical protein
MESGADSAPAGGPAGVVLSAAGPAHVAEALRAARSSLRHNRLPHVLFADREVEAVPGLQIARLQASANPYADKIASMRRSPFERTIYLDTDTYVIGEIAHLLDLLDNYDLAAAHAPGYRGLDDPEVPEAFYELNTGVLVWRSSEQLDAFLGDWQQTYLAWRELAPFPRAGGADALAAGKRGSGGRAADQPAFRRCVWKHGLRLYVLGPEYNMRLGEPVTIVAPVRVIHGRHADLEGLAARVNERHGPRRWPRRPTLRERLARRFRSTVRRPRRIRARNARGSAGRDPGTR